MYDPINKAVRVIIAARLKKRVMYKRKER